MGKQNWPEEPWVVHSDGVETCNDGLAPTSRKRGLQSRLAAKVRRVACVNALAGIRNPAAVPGLIEAARAAEIILRKEGYISLSHKLALALAALDRPGEEGEDV